MVAYALIAVFVLGYGCIALEHKIGINKSSVALLMCGALWSLLGIWGPAVSPELTASAVSTQAVEFLGDTCEIIVFLLGAMTIVDLIDLHGGFSVITEHITTRRKIPLLWIAVCITFVMSSLLDNMTTAIIMVMLLRRLVSEQRERWIFASAIVIAANSGGAWSPIGDVTTIMLWTKGNVTALKLIAALIVPCLVSVVVPTLIASRLLRGGTVAENAGAPDAERPKFVSARESNTILYLGTGLLVAVPVFRSVTGLPPYMGVMIALGIMWVFTEIMYDRKHGVDESVKNRIPKVLSNIDMPTILFFLGILMSVSALQGAGILTSMASALDRGIHNVYAIDALIGLFSSVIDNVPLVAASMGMYPMPDPTAVAAAADPAFTAMFMQDGAFWHLLAYCAGVGGSLLIIGSAAGVVAMGIEKINFFWYFKNISLPALAGYAGGIAVFVFEHSVLGL